MMFHGFRSVNEWLNALKRDKGNPWLVKVHSYVQTRKPDWSFTDKKVDTETLPYGDRKTDIQDARPKEIKLVTVNLDGSGSAVQSWHLFSGNLDCYFADGTRDYYAPALEAWGFTEMGTPQIIR